MNRQTYPWKQADRESGGFPVRLKQLICPFQFKQLVMVGLLPVSVVHIRCKNVYIIVSRIEQLVRHCSIIRDLRGALGFQTQIRLSK